MPQQRYLSTDPNAGKTETPKYLSTDPHVGTAEGSAIQGDNPYLDGAYVVASERPELGTGPTLLRTLKEHPRAVGATVGGMAGSFAGPVGTASGAAYGDMLAARLSGEHPTMGDALETGLVTAALPMLPAAGRGVLRLASNPAAQAVAKDAAEWAFPRTARVLRGVVGAAAPEAESAVAPTTIRSFDDLVRDVVPDFKRPVSVARSVDEIPTPTPSPARLSLRPDKYAAREAGADLVVPEDTTPVSPRRGIGGEGLTPEQVAEERAFKQRLIDQQAQAAARRAAPLTPVPAHTPAPTAPTLPASWQRLVTPQGPPPPPTTSTAPLGLSDRPPLWGQPSVVVDNPARDMRSLLGADEAGHQMGLPAEEIRLRSGAGKQRPMVVDLADLDRGYARSLMDPKRGVLPPLLLSAFIQQLLGGSPKDDRP